METIRVFERGDMERSDKLFLLFYIINVFCFLMVKMLFVVCFFIAIWFWCTVVYLCVFFDFVEVEYDSMAILEDFFLCLHCLVVYFCLDASVVVYFWICCSFFFYYFIVFVVFGFLNVFFCVFSAKLQLLYVVMFLFYVRINPFLFLTLLLVVKNNVTKKEVMVRYRWKMFCSVLFFDSYSLFFVLYLCTLFWCNDDGLVYFLQCIGLEWLFFVFNCFFIYDMAKNGHDMEKLQMQRFKMKKYEIL